MNTELTGRSIVANVSLQDSGETFKGINPATGESLKPAYVCIDPSAIGAIAAQAQKAFEIYRTKSGAEKAAFLRAIADNIAGVVEDLVERMPAETGLPEPRVRGEAGRTMGQLRLFAGLVEKGEWVDARIETSQPDRAPLPKPDVRSMLQPLGPVVVFCASNFPLAFSVAGGDTAAALASGCPVIVKAHHAHPGTAEIVGQAIAAAATSCGMPDGVFSLVYGSGRSVGTALVQEPNVRAVGFTGSRAGGTALMKVAAERPAPIPVYAEMSSINPVLVLADKLNSSGEEIAKGLAGSVTLGAGQFCTNPGLVILPAGEAADAFAATALAALAGAEGCLLNSGIADAYRGALASRAGISAAGVEILHSNPGDSDSRTCKVGSALYKLTAEAYLANPVWAEEAFGPSTTLVTFSNEEELIQIIEGLEGQLTGTIHGSDADITGAASAITALEHRVGRIIYGGFPTGVEVCHSMVHGGPFPSTSDGRSTSVGTMAIERFTRAFCYQSAPQSGLPAELQDANPSGILRQVNGEATIDPVAG
jgi:alpha-ketoglutaric semialdehyde dehydrogenase